MKLLMHIVMWLVKAVLVTFEATWLAVLAAITVMPRLAAIVVSETGLSQASGVVDWVALGLVPYLVLCGLVVWLLVWALRRLLPWTCSKVDVLRDAILRRMDRRDGAKDGADEG